MTVPEDPLLGVAPLAVCCFDPSSGTQLRIFSRGRREVRSLNAPDRGRRPEPGRTGLGLSFPPDSREHEGVGRRYPAGVPGPGPLTTVMVPVPVLVVYGKTPVVSNWWVKTSPTRIPVPGPGLELNFGFVALWRTKL